MPGVFHEMAMLEIKIFTELCFRLKSILRNYWTFWIYISPTEDSDIIHITPNLHTWRTLWDFKRLLQEITEVICSCFRSINLNVLQSFKICFTCLVFPMGCIIDLHTLIILKTKIFTEPCFRSKVISTNY